MEQTLQTQYNLIKEGKGNKAYFLKSAYRLFPDMLSPVNTFEDTVKILKNKSIISEGIGGVVTSGKKQDWQSIFNENMTTLQEVKEKEEPSKEVLDDLKHNFDYKDDKNYDNLFGQEFLQGYYTEMKDPKNVDKDVEELRAIVAKNLTKDRQYYVKNGQFGTKGLGYTTEAPGLGEPKEAKGKYKSSGYGDIPKSKDLKESVLRSQIHLLIKEVLAETEDKKEDKEEAKKKKEELKKLNKDWKKKLETGDIDEAKKPSAGLTKKEKSKISNKLHKGEDIGKKGKGFEKVAKAAEKQYGSKEAGEKVAAAAMWKAQAAKKK